MDIAKTFLDKFSESIGEIDSIAGTSWIDEMEKRSGRKYPELFHYLYSHYTFPSFEVGDIEFSSNADDENIQNTVFCDPIIAKVTLDNGYMHFARSSDGSYDPICFNTSRRRNDDYEIVRLDHEAILQFEKIKIVKVIARTFREFVEANVDSE